MPASTTTTLPDLPRASAHTRTRDLVVRGTYFGISRSILDRFMQASKYKLTAEEKPHTWSIAHQCQFLVTRSDVDHGYTLNPDFTSPERPPIVCTAAQYEIAARKPERYGGEELDVRFTVRLTYWTDAPVTMTIMATTGRRTIDLLQYEYDDRDTSANPPEYRTDLTKYQEGMISDIRRRITEDIIKSQLPQPAAIDA